MVPALRDNSGLAPDAGSDGLDDGWGNGPAQSADAAEPPRGGIPLPDAEPAACACAITPRSRERCPRESAARRASRRRRPVREPAPARPERATLSSARGQSASS